MPHLDKYMAAKAAGNKSKSKKDLKESISGSNNKTRKKREELSVYASRSIKKEHVEIVVSFN